MTEIQKKLLDMLVWFDGFCRANNLRYYALGGTLLGACRHQGFIPWDDDVDVGMPRPDYERLAELMGSEIHDGYVLENADSSDPRFCYPFTKLFDTSTTLIEHVSTGLERGLFLDIFPLDGIGNDKKPDLRWFRKIKRRNQFYIARITSVRKGRSFLKNLAVVVSKWIPDRWVDNTALRKKIDRMCRKYDYDNSRWAGSLLGNYWEQELMPREIFGRPTEYMFEGHPIFGYEHADEYLKMLFGDWHQLPPVEKQVSNHDFVLFDLQNSYLQRDAEPASSASRPQSAGTPENHISGVYRENPAADKTALTEFQTKLLNMLVWFDGFCRANGLRYYALGGTLLGACRHQGFIPWDDDVDVGMPRKDYERLAELMGDAVHEGYVLETEYSADPKFCYFFSKLYDTSTTLAENVATGLKRGLFLDVFPLDGIGNGDHPDLKTFNRIKHKAQFYLARVTSIREGRSFMKNLATVVAKFLPDRMVDNTALRKEISGMCKKYDFDSSRWAGSLLEDLSKHSIVPQYYFGTPTDYSFEGHQILGAEHADEFLTALFGDWHQLPPPEKRVTNHDFISCDLHRSYLE